MSKRRWFEGWERDLHLTNDVQIPLWGTALMKFVSLTTDGSSSIYSKYITV